MSELTNPHDRFFKAAFSRPEITADFLKHYLPESVASQLDLTPTAVKLRKGSFVDRHLRQHASDLLYQVRFRDGREGLVYILFEHKSYQDPLAAFQLLRYMVRIWEHEQQRARGSTLLPIIPLVVYHGRTVWRTPTTFGALFDGPDALRGYWPEFAYQITDLSVQRDEAIRDVMAAVQTVLMLLREVPGNRLAEQLPNILAHLREVVDTVLRFEYLEMGLRYITEANESITDSELQGAIEDALPEIGGGAMTTLAEKWVTQGLERGLQRGIAEGTRNGLLAGIELALELKFGGTGLALMPEIREIGDVATLRNVHAAIRTAETPAEVRSVFVTAG